MVENNWHDYTNRKARRGQANRKAYLLNELKDMTLHIDHLAIQYGADMPEATQIQIDHLKWQCKEMMAELELITYQKV